MVKVSVNRYVLHRIARTRKEVNSDIHKIRSKTLKNLKEVFDASSKIARGETKNQRINQKMVPITLRQRRRWLLVAGHTANIIKNITDNFDERQIDLQLNELEKLVKEASKPNPENPF